VLKAATSLESNDGRDVSGDWHTGRSNQAIYNLVSRSPAAPSCSVKSHRSMDMH